MPPIGPFSIDPLKQLLCHKGGSVAKQVGPALLMSQDVLDLRLLPELQKLKPPKMGKLERFMSKVRGTNDKIEYPSKVKLNNLDKVDETVYRGAMPESGPEFEKLKTAYNVRTIIDLRGGETTSPEAIEFERRWAEYHGIEYIHIPMDSHKAPSKDELKHFFQTIEDAKANGTNVYVHCKHGIDRTGSMIAAYETKLGRPQKEIYGRMKARGYNALHKKTRPAQREFVKGADLKSKVDAAEAQRVKELLPPIPPSKNLFEMMGWTAPDNR